jgi:hypothetical protein
MLTLIYPNGVLDNGTNRAHTLEQEIDMAVGSYMTTFGEQGDMLWRSMTNLSEELVRFLRI